ncbi:MAG: hypothetical protein V4719_09410 [Planctomycetota bacterium]
MSNCQYCDKTLPLTLEHIVPKWYSRTPGKTSTFNADAPLTHLAGDLEIRDVCDNCNSNLLRRLDDYGKLLYTKYFEQSVFSGEKVTFEYDGDLLTRWLLKMSYNSARARNADVRVLREFRKSMLGQAPLDPRVQIWISLVPPTDFSNPRNPQPAIRQHDPAADIMHPQWFRISQHRLATYRADHLVQRFVMINSFKFTILVTPNDRPWPAPEAVAWGEAFLRENPDAKPLTIGASTVEVDAGPEHAMASYYPLTWHYPTRFSEIPDPMMAKAVKGEVGVVILQITPEMIDSSDTLQPVTLLNDMIVTRENAFAFRQRVALIVTGYDDDKRELWQIPEVQNYFRELLLQCPFVLMLAHPQGNMLKVLASCWIYEDGLVEEQQNARMSDFWEITFQGLNELSYRLAVSDEVNREVCVAAIETLTGEPYPGE